MTVTARFVLQVLIDVCCCFGKIVIYSYFLNFQVPVITRIHTNRFVWLSKHKSNVYNNNVHSTSIIAIKPENLDIAHALLYVRTLFCMWCDNVYASTWKFCPSYKIYCFQIVCPSAFLDIIAVICVGFILVLQMLQVRFSAILWILCTLRFDKGNVATWNFRNFTTTSVIVQPWFFLQLILDIWKCLHLT